MIQDFHDDPTKVVRLTVRQYHEVKEHVRECLPCQDLCDETAANDPYKFYKGSSN